MTTTTEITIRQPDDFHLHLRDGELLERVLPFTAKVFGRALVMPNLTPPVLTFKDAQNYAQRICEAQAGGDLRKMWGQSFTPLMTIKLTGETTPDIVTEAKAKGVIAAKLYPAGVTTNSADGVSDFRAESLEKVFQAMSDHGMVLCVHAESPGSPSLEREHDFIVHHILRWAKQFPSLKIVIEHATTRIATEVARDVPNVAASLTVHHMLLTIDDIIGDKLNPHHFCKPVAKTEDDRQAIIEAAIGGHPSFFFGSDSAPHLVHAKHTAHAAAGCFTAPVALELLAQVFDDHGSLNTLEMFASENGANFYGLPLNKGTVRLVQKTSTVPGVASEGIPYDTPPRGYENNTNLIPFWAGKEIYWEVAEVVPHHQEEESQPEAEASSA